MTERKPLVQASKVSVDVDALWAQMAAGNRKADTMETSISNGTKTSTAIGQDPQHAAITPPTDTIAKQTMAPPPALTAPPRQLPTNGEATITFKRTYEFAGQMMTEERTVQASSAEARLYLQQQSSKSPASAPTPATGTTQPTAPPKPGFRRPVKKRASMFDSDDSAALNSGSNAPKGPKLTTLEKSKLDWAQHVDQEGLTEELDEHSRAKGTYLGRLDFLGRMDTKREEDLKKGRGK